MTIARPGTRRGTWDPTENDHLQMWRHRMAVMHYRCADVEVDRFARVSAKLEELVKEMRALIDGQEFARLALPDRGRVTDMFMEAVVRKKAIDTVITYRVPLSRVREAANWSDRGQSFDENMLLTKFFHCLLYTSDAPDDLL